MGGETEKPDNGWTVGTLREHLLALMAEADRRYGERFMAQEAATKYAQEKSNEFRAALDDVGKRQIPRTEAEAEFKAIRDQSSGRLQTLNETIGALTARLDRMEGRGTVADPMMAQLVTEVQSLRAAQSEGSGEKSGRLSQRELIAWFIGLVGMLIAIFFALKR
jgi:hypothetical protein